MEFFIGVNHRASRFLGLAGDSEKPQNFMSWMALVQLVAFDDVNSLDAIFQQSLVKMFHSVTDDHTFDVQTKRV